VRHVLHTLEQLRAAEIDVNIGIDFLHAAWNDVSQSTIVNCFRKANCADLPALATYRYAVDNYDIPLAMLAEEEWAVISDGRVIFDHFVSVDDGLLITDEACNQ
jgi:hypothetical protein